jgi:hypothetical protein
VKNCYRRHVFVVSLVVCAEPIISGSKEAKLGCSSNGFCGFPAPQRIAKTLEIEHLALQDGTLVAFSNAAPQVVGTLRRFWRNGRSSIDGVIATR